MFPPRARRLCLVILVAVFSIGFATAPAAAQAEPDSRFVEIFPQLPGFTAPTNQQIADLAQVQLDPNAVSENNPDMTSVFTYFGQFVDHDLTLDNEPSPLTPVNVRTIDPNGRTFRFDLDSVYGKGPQGNPELFEADGKHFKVQNPNPNGVIDLPRNPDGSAILVEGRNDENRILSQIHVAWLLTHNKFVDSGLSYADARARTIASYQHLVLEQFLPHIVGQAAVDGTRNGSLKRFYKIGNPLAPGTPAEFSLAAYRFGHSQVRRAYMITNTSGNVQVFAASGEDLRGGRQLDAGRQIDWGLFVAELTRPDNVGKVNISRKIDPLISSSLFLLPIPGAAASGSNVLAFRNMVRADAYGLASGQDVAKAMDIPVIPPNQITPIAAPGDPAGSRPIPPGFETGTPLWFYILVESSRVADGKTLGPVGGRLVADVFVSLLENDPDGIIKRPTGGPFTFADLFVGAGLAQRP